MSPQIRLAIAGVGNCTSSLIQGLTYYHDHVSDEPVPGLMHTVLGGYRIRDIVPVAAFDVSADKVGKDLAEAIFAPPNCAWKSCDVAPTGVEVMMGPVLDGVPPHLQPFVKVADRKPVDVEKVLRETGADVLVNFIPTGSKDAARYYAQAAINAGVGFVNGIPELIASDPEWAARAEKHGAQLIGDDVKSQVGATILHRTLAKLFVDRGLKITRSYQLNYAGNTDFANLSTQRGASKSMTKEKAVESLVPYSFPLSSGFSFLEVLGDTKTALILLEGEKFGGAPIRLLAKLDVEDSPNSAGVIIDAIRCCKIARDRGVSGALESASAYLMKHPPRQFPDEEARRRLEEFIAGTRER